MWTERVALCSRTKLNNNLTIIYVINLLYLHKRYCQCLSETILPFAHAGKFLSYRQHEVRYWPYAVHGTDPQYHNVRIIQHGEWTTGTDNIHWAWWLGHWGLLYSQGCHNGAQTQGLGILLGESLEKQWKQLHFQGRPVVIYEYTLMRGVRPSPQGCKLSSRRPIRVAELLTSRASPANKYKALKSLDGIINNKLCQKWTGINSLQHLSLCPP